MGGEGHRVCFLVEWLDPSSGVLWKYQLFVYRETREVEMIDVKNRRTFLKRVRCDDLRVDQLYIGSTVKIFARHLKLLDYGDDYTRTQMEAQSARTLAMVKPDAFKNLGKILHAIFQSGFTVNNMKVCKLSREEAEAFYSVHKGKPFYPNLVEFMSSGRICALELIAPNAIAKWRTLIGPTDTARARSEAPQSLRASFGTNGTMNAVHGSDAPETAAQEVNFFFGRPGVGRCAVEKNTTVCVIKPHAMADGLAGLVLDIIQERFTVTAAQMFRLDMAAAAEFCEVYKGVLAAGEFNAMVDELTTGPCIAVEVADRDGGNPVEPFRELCGPMDPQLGRVLRPKSLRAQFGLSKTRNAVHCTDLAEDGELESQYFFSILQQ